MSQTVIGTSMVIDGEITGDESLVIQGTVKGKISVKETLLIENSAVVEADVEASIGCGSAPSTLEHAAYT